MTAHDPTRAHDTPIFAQATEDVFSVMLGLGITRAAQIPTFETPDTDERSARIAPRPAPPG